ncbi:MAG: hypothetical protein LBF97_03560 [Elusimicrobiota bacterium]|jgi:hypothetical protein|nr:hypothetical protein [Elusimicrobiota bacterium]
MLRLSKLFAILFIFLFFIVSAFCGEGGFLGDKLSVDASFSYYSKYIFRGQILDKNPVLQQGLGFSFYDFSISAWNNQPVQITGTDELDFTLGYGKTFNEKINLGLGYTRYTYANDSSLGDNEFTFSAAYDAIVTPSFLFAYYKVDGSDANEFQYYEFKLAYSQPIIENLTANIDGIYGLYAGDIEGSYVDFGISVDVNLLENLTFSPNVRLLTGRTDKLEVATGEDETDIYTGLSFGYSF